ncbi:GntR family transcriptional regulator [Arthrobacter crystallopoietes]|uniref:DNA-binding transcriptional regulator, GntR family n=1 Tax=Crystallibacter crystallopoietes TaxID=37928 RepID=A0A1H1AMV6_9MICC|nr:GntR family transcriptional regulator [Arthrobacter crystallopoietes]AUI51467.1 GntR family transcriptional regulator [Arthrobacter crystallopoietes]SDQ40997.1 DNA-binding transcriptional regulator, GntR family [Arthrobacter crystallopoietes]
MSGTSAKRPPTAQAFALAELRRMIIAGEVKAGEPLRQDALAHRLGVSRVPLREAFKVLEGEGQIVYEPHRGYKVAQLSLADLLEVYRIRQLLETEAAHAAVERAGESDLQAMKEAAREVERASAAADILPMTEANRRFHFVLFSAAGMPRLERLIQVLWDATDTYRFIYYGAPTNRQRVEDEHNLIIDAFAARDAERLVSELNKHRDHAVQALQAFLSRQ